MDVSGLDFVLINIISYVCGLATGLIICCKHKDKLLVKSRSLDNISSNISGNMVGQYNPPIVASAPSAITAVPATNPHLTKITLE